MDPHIERELIALLPRLRRFAFGLTGSWDDADDLVQAACERAITRLEQWTAGTRLDSWLYRIIQTIRIDQGRSQKVRDRHLETASRQEPSVVDGERIALGRLGLDATRRAMSALSEDQRAVVMLVCVEGLSYAETAAALGIPTGTVTSRLTRARAALGRMLGHDFVPTPTAAPASAPVEESAP